MQTEVIFFSTPKHGNTIEEYEDAYWPKEQSEEDLKSFSFAVADGASETSYAKEWAALLVEAYCRGKFKRRPHTKSLDQIRTAWNSQFTGLVLPWYAEEKIRSGAFASLLGLTITESDVLGMGKWTALAVGDSCLFHVREGKLLYSFPLNHSEQFNSRPLLLSSALGDDCNKIVDFKSTSGAWCLGDTFYLMTDALACWFLQQNERGSDPWRINIKDPGLFAKRIKFLRKRKGLRNDDITYLRIEPLLNKGLE